MSIVYLNGAFIKDTDAKISPFDRGFLFGDALYDVLSVHEGRIIALREHLSRLTNSLKTMSIPMPYPIDTFTRVLEQLVKYHENAGPDLTLYIQISRGCEMPRTHIPGKNLQPTVFITCSPSVKLNSAYLKKGVAAITSLDTRRHDCHLKLTALSPNITALQQARATDAQEAIFIRNGYALEGSSSNLFIVIDGNLITPAAQIHIVRGITRDIILQLAKKNGVPFEEADISIETLRKADEIWLTGSIKEIYPIVRLDESNVGTGVPGPLWKKMHNLYQDYKKITT